MNAKKKIVSLESLKRIVSRLHKEGRVIAFTNGCFDLLHFGHVNYLERAKSKDRVLIVGLNSDSSVRKIKGNKRPLVKENYRAGVLAALECVDYITVFKEETPFNLIKALKPDVLIKGADWADGTVVGADIVKSYGGRVELLKYLPNLSTTQMVKTILKKCKN